MGRFSRLLAGSCVAVLLVGCASESDSVATWERESDRTPRYRSMLVVAFDPNDSERLILEKAVAADLVSQFTEVTPSSDIGLDLRKERWTTFISWVEGNKKDAVITLRPFQWDKRGDPDEYLTRQSDHLSGLMSDGWIGWEAGSDYGVELVVWDTSDWHPVWRARSSRIDRRYKIEQIADFVEYHARANGWTTNPY